MDEISAKKLCDESLQHFVQLSQCIALQLQNHSESVYIDTKWYKGGVLARESQQFALAFGAWPMQETCFADSVGTLWYIYATPSYVNSQGIWENHSVIDCRCLSVWWCFLSVSLFDAFWFGPDSVVHGSFLAEMNLKPWWPEKYQDQIRGTVDFSQWCWTMVSLNVCKMPDSRKIALTTTTELQHVIRVPQFTIGCLGSGRYTSILWDWTQGLTVSLNTLVGFEKI